MSIIKTNKEVDLMREAGKKLALILRELRKEVRAGITTEYLDKKTRELLKKVDAKSAFLGYKPHGAAKPYPAVLCVSVNDVVVHGVPGTYEIQPGDVVSVDMGLVHEGYYADAAFTLAVEPVSKDVARLLHATEEALREGVKMAKPGNTLGDIGWAISERVQKAGFSVAQNLGGHGIGRALHEEPFIWNVGRRGEGDVLRAGMVIAIEPMLTMGKPQVKQLKDDSYATKDGSIAAHFEHTVAITPSGAKILTVLSP
jgi:methionyl aminopeptidase